MELNLPSFDVKVRRLPSGQAQIFDELRQKYVALTPEEWVRQHFVNFLIGYRSYPKGLIANEVGLTFNKCRRRCDTIVYDKFAQPIAIIEYKAPDIEINIGVFDQIVRYNMVLGVKYLFVSNGLTHYCCRISQKEGSDKLEYVFLRDIPAYELLN